MKVEIKLCDRCGAQIDTSAHGWGRTDLWMFEEIQTTYHGDLCQECIWDFLRWLQIPNMEAQARITITGQESSKEDKEVKG